MSSEAERTFARALQSGSSSLPERAQIFAPFIGSWDLVVRWFDEAGALTRAEAGEWHFAWVLEGRGVQDVWIVPPRTQRARGSPYEYGTEHPLLRPEAGLMAVDLGRPHARRRAHLHRA